MTDTSTPKELAPGQVLVIADYFAKKVHVQYKDQRIAVDRNLWRQLAVNMGLDFRQAMGKSKMSFIGKLFPETVEKHELLAALWQYKNKPFPASILKGMGLID